MNPIVQPVNQAVNAGLIVVRAKAAIEYAANVGRAVAIGVFGIQNVRGGAYQHALSPGRHAGGKGNAVQKHATRIVSPVAVNVGQYA